MRASLGLLYVVFSALMMWAGQEALSFGLVSGLSIVCMLWSLATIALMIAMVRVSFQRA